MVCRAASAKTSPALREEDALLQRLEQALSEDEIRRVFACALRVLNDASREQLFAHLGAETAAVLAPLLSPPRKGARGGKPAPGASKGKLQQEWDRAWERWNAVVRESGDEEGKYVVQEAHWEPPYVDTTSIAADLDAVAAQMRPLIPRVIAERVAPDFSFADAVGALDEELYSGLPDWIEPGGGESCYLGPEVTSCLIEWEWTVAQREGRGAPEYLDELRDLDQGLGAVTLHEPTIEKFVLGLSNEELRAVLSSMTQQRRSARWRDAFTSAHGSWAVILRNLSRRWDPALFNETSRANIAQSWTLAIPLIRDAQKRKAHAEAAAIVDEAVRSLLRLDEKNRWDPRRQLIVERGLSYYVGERAKNVETLLQLWQKTAEAQGQAEIAAALAIQLTALRTVDEGDVMLEAFRAVPASFEHLREALFAAFRELIVRRTLHTGGSSPRVPCGDWVRALVDAARAGAAGAPAFAAAVRAALEEARAPSAIKPVAAARDRWTALGYRAGPLFALAILTRDLDATAPTLGKTAPRLAKLLADVAQDERGHLDATRRAWCKRLGGPALLPEVLAFWHDNAIRFAPDPGATTGGYARSADWLAAVREIHPEAAHELLARWADIHRLKSNLWRDLAARGIPIPDGVRKAPGQAGQSSRRGRG